MSDDATKRVPFPVIVDPAAKEIVSRQTWRPDDYYASVRLCSGDEPEIFDVRHSPDNRATARIAACAPEALRLLLELESRGDEVRYICPCCGAGWRGKQLHEDDCRLGALLRKAGLR